MNRANSPCRDALKVTVDKLKPNSEYHFSVRSKNQVQQAPYSPYRAAKTLPSEQPSSDPKLDGLSAKARYCQSTAI